MVHYIRKTVMGKEIYEVDLSPFDEIQDYLKDMEQLRKLIDELKEKMGIYITFCDNGNEKIRMEFLMKKVI